MKIGIFGGTFNPIHNGHISIANSVYEHFKLDRVMFMPNKIPPHKKYDILDENSRVEMVSLAILKYPYFNIEKCEIDKESISYTYESLEYLKCIYKDDELFFIIGSDSFLEFDNWKNIDKIFKNACIIVYLRDYTHKNEVFLRRSYYIKLYNCNIEIFSGEIINISSTDIRKMILNRCDIKGYIPEEIEEYIISKKLYVE